MKNHADFRHLRKQAPLMLILPMLLSLTVACGRVTLENTRGNSPVTTPVAGLANGGPVVTATAAAPGVSTSATASVGTAPLQAAGATAEPAKAADAAPGHPPSAEALSVFPGVLRAMTMPREEVLALLGPAHETFANLPMAYTTYTWNAVGLALEYDDLTGRLYSVRTGDQTHFLDGAEYLRADVNGDGLAEGLCAYETVAADNAQANHIDPHTHRQGKVALIDEASGKAMAEAEVRRFDGYSHLTVLTAYGAAAETLLTLDTQSEGECEVLAFTSGQLVSMLPADTLKLDEEAKVSTEEALPSRVKLEVPSLGLSFQCVLPDRLADALAAGESFDSRFLVSRRPVVTDEGLSLRIRHSLQGRLGTAYALGDTTVGRYVDLGHITQTYLYLGEGQWKLLSSEGGAKYTDGAEGARLSAEDMVAGQTYLFSTLYDIEDTYGLDPSRYTDFDLIAGLRFLYKGLRLEIANARVAAMEADAACPLETVRGLKTGDSRGTAMSLLGLPDSGYFDDRMWTYWFYRNGEGPEDRILSLDSLTVTFSGDKVSHIRMEGYVPID